MNTKEKDRILINELVEKISNDPKLNNDYRNTEIREKFSNIESLSILNELEELLASKDTFNLNIENHIIKDLDGEELGLFLARAATTDMWPMGTHCWIKDNALIGDRLLSANSNFSGIENHRKLGKKMLLSCLNLMSTVSQLNRVKEVIKGSDPNNPSNWPYLFMGFNNLNATSKESWNHMQIAWQFLLVSIYKAINAKLISVEELSEKNKEFMSLSIPFLIKVGFPNYESAGCWEEIVANRLSVLSVDCSFLIYSKDNMSKTEFSFLSEIWSDFSDINLDKQNTLLDEAILKGQKHIAEKIPFESACYEKGDPRYRKADMALMYFLQYSHIIFKDKEEISLYNDKVLEQILSLFDKETFCIKRYQNDSYQRQGYFRNSIAQKLKSRDENLSGEFSSMDSFISRNKIVPKGREASWTHSVWQLSAWAGRIYRKTKKIDFFNLQKEMFEAGLKTITGFGEYSLEQDSSKETRVVEIPAFRIPECYISDIDEHGNEHIFPSPHTPLNWAIGEAISAFSSLRESLKIK